MHLTLKFLGEVPSENVEVLTSTRYLAQADSFGDSFDIHLVAMGPSQASNGPPELIYIGILASRPHWKRSRRHMESETLRLGYTAVERAFAPHLTIGPRAHHITRGRAAEDPTALSKSQRLTHLAQPE
jgi:2'-5' RNA ligase